MDGQAPIGVFDSGLGGLSVLREMRKHLPHEAFIYYGDTLHAPYGVRPPEEILQLSLDAADQLVQKGIKALVIACNTATGVSQEALQQRLSIPVIGIQPALEAAQNLRRRGEILVLATPATFKTARYAKLLERHGNHVIGLPAPGLMEYVEREELSGPGLDAFLDQLLAPVAGRQIDVVVLGCTHYPFLSAAIAPRFPGARLIDDSPRVITALREALHARGHVNTQAGQGSLALYSSGGDAAIARMRRLLAAE